MTHLALRPVRPAEDAALLHSWVTAPRAAFWGMLDKPVAEVAAIYAYIDEQPHLSAELLLLDEVPVALFQTYDPEVDEIGQFYDRAPGDLGVHLFLADDLRRAGHTPALIDHLIAVTKERGAGRLVLEPDAANQGSITLLERLGASRGPLVQMPTKLAQFMFLNLN